MVDMIILVTGGCGFIGSNFINHFLANNSNATIVNIDKLDYCANVSNVTASENYVFVKGDIHYNNTILNMLFILLHKLM